LPYLLGDTLRTAACILRICERTQQPFVQCGILGLKRRGIGSIIMVSRGVLFRRLVSHIDLLVRHTIAPGHAASAKYRPLIVR
jgi:hypothetical protein